MWRLEGEKILNILTLYIVVCEPCERFQFRKASRGNKRSNIIFPHLNIPLQAASVVADISEDMFEIISSLLRASSKLQVSVRLQSV